MASFVAIACPHSAAAAVVDLPPGEIARQAYAGVRHQPHRAAVDLTTSLTIRLPGQRLSLASHETVAQRVDDAGRADGVIVTKPRADLFDLASGVSRARVLIGGKIALMFAPQLSPRPLAGTASSFGSIWALMNPSSPLIRFPNATVVPEFTVVPSADPGVVRLQGEIPEFMAGRFIEALTRPPGQGGSFEDEPLSSFAEYVARRVTLDVDATTGRLLKTTVEVQIRIVIGDPDVIDTVVGDLLVRTVFVPSRVGEPVAPIVRPARTAPMSRVIRNLVSDELARIVLTIGAIDVEGLRAKLGDYRVTLRDLKIVSSGTVYLNRPGAKSWQDEVSIGGLGADQYRLTTQSRSGRVFVLSRLPGLRRLRGSCTNPGGTPCRNWHPEIEFDGAAVVNEEDQLGSGPSSLRIGVELLRHMASAAR